MEHTNRKFGIEIEFVGACKYEVAAAINAQGVDCQVEYYNHTTRPHWKIVSDSSLDSIRGYAAELVSPILEGEDGILQLKTVVDALNSVDGVTVNRSCGLHVHLNCADLNVKEIQKIYERYAQYEEQIDLCMPRSRRGSLHWCKTLKDGGNVASVKRAKKKENIAHMLGRYYKVNLTQIAQRGAIEFRQHSGTTDFTKIYNWLSFLMQFLESSRLLVDVGKRKKPSKSRAYAEFRNVIENANGTMEWRGKAWIVKLNENIQHWPNWFLNDFIDEIHTKADKQKFGELLKERFGLIGPYNFETPRQNAQQTNVADEGVFHGITLKIQDYLNERKEELA